jgi:hypothetical protein
VLVFYFGPALACGGLLWWPATRRSALVAFLLTAVVLVGGYSLLGVLLVIQGAFRI